MTKVAEILLVQFLRADGPVETAGANRPSIEDRDFVVHDRQLPDRQPHIHPALLPAFGQPADPSVKRREPEGVGGVGEGHPQVLGLAARIAAGEVGVAEQACGGVAEGGVGERLVAVRALADREVAAGESDRAVRGGRLRWRRLCDRFD